MYDLTHKAVAGKIDELWPTRYPSLTPVIFAENQPEQPPTDGSTWVRWSIRPADQFSADCTGIAERGIGVIYFQVFTPETKGTRVAHEIARKIGTIFNEANFATDDGGAVRCQRVKTAYAGKDRAGLVQHNCTVTFWEDAPAVNAEA